MSSEGQSHFIKYRKKSRPKLPRLNSFSFAFSGRTTIDIFSTKAIEYFVLCFYSSGEVEGKSRRISRDYRVPISIWMILWGCFEVTGWLIIKKFNSSEKFMQLPLKVNKIYFLWHQAHTMLRLDATPKKRWIGFDFKFKKFSIK